MSDFNQQVIEEFRANDGRVGGPFEGRPMVLVHHVGRRSGTERVAPLVYLPGEDAGTLYVFASKGGAPSHPDWYRNLIAVDTTTAEVGHETFQARVEEVTGEERDRIYAKQVEAQPQFGEYAEKAAGIRVIPVLKLTRV